MKKNKKKLQKKQWVRYIRHIILALLNKNPFQEELERVKSEYEQTANNLKDAQEQIFIIEEKLSGAESLVKDYQNLTENLRERITDKDTLFDRERREHSRIVQHTEELKNQEISKLRESESILKEKVNGLKDDLEETLEQLQTSRHALAQECLSQHMLRKTNDGLDDLCRAMSSGDAEAVKKVVEYLDWSNHLSRIAQYHLQVLLRNKELEERQ